jgi:hypothetical protein
MICIPRGTHLAGSTGKFAIAAGSICGRDPGGDEEGVTIVEAEGIYVSEAVASRVSRGFSLMLVRAPPFLGFQIFLFFAKKQSF